MPDNPPPQIILQQAPPTALGRYGRFLLFALFIAVMIIIGQYASYQAYFSPPDQPRERFHSLVRSGPRKIAIITVDGVIRDAEGSFVKQQIDRVREDDSVAAVVLRIDSPGGSVMASDYLYHHLRQLAEDRDLPMVVSMGGLFASGGYYVAMAAGAEPDILFAEPTTVTGSIGVVIPHYDFSGLLTDHQIMDDSVVSHPDKLMGSMTRALTPEQRAEERKLLQGIVDDFFARFKSIVAAGRPKLKADPDELNKTATGQLFTADQALALGLIDKVGFIDDAVSRAVELSGVDRDQLRCVRFDPPPTTLSSLLGARANLAPALPWDVSALMDLASPRAYYISTWLPPVLTRGR